MRIVTVAIRHSLLLACLFLISCANQKISSSSNISSSSPSPSQSSKIPNNQNATPPGSGSEVITPPTAATETTKQRTKEQSQKIAADIVKDPQLKHWAETLEFLHKLAKEGFPSAIDAADAEARSGLRSGPSYKYILETYGPADRIETSTIRHERFVYWYGPLGVIVSKEDGQVWGFQGDPPQK